MDFGSDFVYVGVDDREEVEEEELTQSLDSAAKADIDDDGQTCMLDLLDTAGQEEFSALRDQYTRTAHGLLIVYDITSPDSLQYAEIIYEWSDSTIPAVLCGNKSDLEHERKVSNHEGRQMAKRLKIPFIETSAKTGHNVALAFETLIREIPRPNGSYKIPIVGNGGVGKSALTVQYVSDTFLDNYDPTIEDTYRKQVQITGLKISTKPAVKAKKSGSFFNSLRRKLSFKKRPDIKHHPGADAPRMTPASRKTTAVEKADTNVVMISLGTLSQAPDFVTGDPLYCGQCQAVLSKSSKDSISFGAEKAIWTCEFCGQVNKDLAVDKEEIPKGESFDFLLSPPDVKEDVSKDVGDERNQSDKGSVVYCIDISGSMDVTVEVPQSQSAWKDMKNKFAGIKDSSVKMVSRLACIKEAVIRQLERLQLENPGKKVALVTFGSEVWIHGDGQQPLQTVSGNILENYNQLLDLGKLAGTDLQLQAISDSLSWVSGTVNGLRTTGCTALGPALSICAGMVSDCPGSEIILCTDGAPNSGVGSLSNGQDGAFYSEVGEYAKSNNTVISILAVEGEPVGLQQVGVAASITMGTVNILHPLEMTRQIRLISQNPIIATSVDVRVILHPVLVFDEPRYPQNQSIIVKEVGNAMKDTDLTFHYRVKDRQTSPQTDRIPFQVQIHYTLKDGSRCLRVITRVTKITKDRAEMEKAVNVAVTGLAAVQRSAALAQEGKSKAAKDHLHSVQRMVKRGAHTSAQQEELYVYVSEARDLDSELMSLEKEGAAGGSTDNRAKVFQTKLSSNLTRFQGASNKKDVALGRKTDQNLRDQYYGYSY